MKLKDLTDAYIVHVHIVYLYSVKFYYITIHVFDYYRQTIVYNITYYGEGDLSF
jgi:hypothetical protein